MQLLFSPYKVRGAKISYNKKKNREPMREIFNRTEDADKQIQIEVELDLEDFRGEYPSLFSVFIKYDASLANETIEEFLETKESLILALRHHTKAVYAGMRVVDGWSELYFYAPDSKDLNHIAKKQLSDTGYVYESNVVRDSKWDFYHKYLLPTELEHHHIQSAKIIFLLSEEGDSLLDVREVEHYVVFDTPSQKQRFLEKVLEKGYSLKDDLSSDDYEHGVAIVKEHNVTFDEVKGVVEELYGFVKKEKAYYEGWSTVLVCSEEV